MTPRRWFPSVSATAVTAWVTLGFIGIFVVWPVAAIMERSLGERSLSAIVDIATRPGILRALRFTLIQALWSTVVTVIVALPIAHVLARYSFWGRSVIRAVTLIPFVLPTMVVSAAIQAALGHLGAATQRSLPAIIAAHVFLNVAVIIRVVSGYWESLDRRPEQAAALLGASPPRVWLEITLPRLIPVIVGAASVVFLFCFTSYGVILVLGGPGMATLETEIRRYAIFRQEFDVAAVLGLMQLLVVVVLSVASALAQRRLVPSGSYGGRSTRSRPHGMRQWIYVSSVIAVVIIGLGGPMLALVETSFRVGDGYGIDHYRALWGDTMLLPVSPLHAVWNSIRIGIMASLIAAIVGVPAARAVAQGGRLGRSLEWLLLVPLGISAATLGFGYLLAFTVLDFRRSQWLLPLAHAVIALPFVITSVAPAVRGIGGHLDDAAAMLGARPWTRLHSIEWPLIRPAVATAIGFGLAVSIGEFGATSFMSRGSESFTAPLAVFRLLSQPGTAIRGQAMALSVVIGLMVAVLAALLERGRHQRVGLL